MPIFSARDKSANLVKKYESTQRKFGHCYKAFNPLCTKVLASKANFIRSGTRIRSC